MSLPYNLYMAEAGGYLNTRESKIQRVIQQVKAYPADEVPNVVFHIICEQCGIEVGSLTEAEIARIQNAVKS